MKLKGFFIDPEGKVRRGAPSFEIGEEGEDVLVSRQHNTGITYPRDVKEVSEDKVVDEKPSD